MATTKATVESVLAKAQANKAAEAAKETKAPAEKTEPAKKAAAPKKETVKKEAAPKKEVAKKEPVKKEAAPKKAPAKKTTTTKASAKSEVNFYIEFAGNQLATDVIIEKAKEVCGKKTIKSLNVYYQPENGMVYFTADGEEGSFAF